MTTEEIQTKLNLLRQEYKLHPSKILELRGRALKIALELRLAKTAQTSILT